MTKKQKVLVSLGLMVLASCLVFAYSGRRIDVSDVSSHGLDISVDYVEETTFGIDIHYNSDEALLGDVRFKVTVYDYDGNARYYSDIEDINTPTRGVVGIGIIPSSSISSISIDIENI